MRQVLELNPRAERAWLWLSSVVETEAERRVCLQQVLAMNPANDAARRGLEHLATTNDMRSVPTQPKVIPQSPAGPVGGDEIPDQPQADRPDRETGQPTTGGTRSDRKRIAWTVTVVLGLIVTILAFVLPTQLRNRGRQAGTPTPNVQDEVLEVIYEHVAAHNAEDIDKYVATIHSAFGDQESLRDSIEQMYDTYDLETVIRDVEVLEASESVARVSFVLITRKVRGPVFLDNRVDGVFTLRREEGDWKLYDQEIVNFEYLE